MSVAIGPSVPRGDGYFRNAGEADDWLDFESDAEEVEQRFFSENDRTTEWQQWRAAWVAGVA